MVAVYQCMLILLVCYCRTSLGNFDLTLMHTNDVHAKFVEFNKYLSECSAEESDRGDCFGGMARHVTITQEIRNSTENVVYLNAGDFFQGTLWYTYYKGLATAHFTEKLRIDASCFGNHEFDDGVEVLSTYLTNLSFPVVTCNLDSSREPLLQGLYRPSLTLTVGGQDIGVVGYITSATRTLQPIEFIKNLVFEDEVESIRRDVNALLSAGVDKIFVVGHGGFMLDQRIAEQVEGIDVIVGGHSNTFLYTGDPPSGEVPNGDYPFVVKQDNGAEVLLVQAYGYGKYMGNLELTFDDQGVVTAYGGNPILLDKSVEQDPDTLAEIKEWAKPLEAWTGKRIGETHVLLDGARSNCRAKECSLGNLLADAILYSHIVTHEVGDDWTDIAIAVINGGTIRGSIQQGEITVAHVFEALPFHNEIVAFRLQGVFVREMFEQSVAKLIPGDLGGGFLQISGLKVEYNMHKPLGERVVRVQVRCADCKVPRYENLDADKMYGMLTSAFILSGGDGYSMIQENAVDELPIGLVPADVVADYVAQHSPIITGLDDRITFIEDVDKPAQSQAPSAKLNIILLVMSLYVFLK